MPINCKTPEADHFAVVLWFVCPERCMCLRDTWKWEDLSQAYGTKCLTWYKEFMIVVRHCYVTRNVTHLVMVVRRYHKVRSYFTLWQFIHFVSVLCVSVQTEQLVHFSRYFLAVRQVFKSLVHSRTRFLFLFSWPSDKIRKVWWIPDKVVLYLNHF